LRLEFIEKNIKVKSVNYINLVILLVISVSLIYFKNYIQFHDKRLSVFEERLEKVESVIDVFLALNTFEEYEQE